MRRPIPWLQSDEDLIRELLLERKRGEPSAMFGAAITVFVLQAMHLVASRQTDGPSSMASGLARVELAKAVVRQCRAAVERDKARRAHPLLNTNTS